MRAARAVAHRLAASPPGKFTLAVGVGVVGAQRIKDKLVTYRGVPFDEVLF